MANILYELDKNHYLRALEFWSPGMFISAQAWQSIVTPSSYCICAPSETRLFRCVLRDGSAQDDRSIGKSSCLDCHGIIRHSSPMRQLPYTPYGGVELPGAHLITDKH